VIAHLGMYDMPGTAAANDAFWQAIRAALGHGPQALDRGTDFWTVWQSPDLLLAQTCGYPFRARLHGRVRLVGTPDYGLPGCPPGHYNSVLVARAEDAGQGLAAFDGARLAYNEALSQSGWAGPVHHLAQAGLRPGALLETGGHARSAEAVASGSADLAGIDALTWALLEEHRPDLTARLQVLERTAPTPALPYVTAPTRDAGALAAAIREAIRAMPAAHRATLHLRGLEEIPAEMYLAVPTPPGPDAFFATT
jgi:ABC-type phosphate/phosphonate transport system substrate-binding protein